MRWRLATAQIVVEELLDLAHGRLQCLLLALQVRELLLGARLSHLHSGLRPHNLIARLGRERRRKVICQLVRLLRILA